MENKKIRSFGAGLFFIRKYFLKLETKAYIEGLHMLEYEL